MKLDKELYTQHAKRLAAILNEKSSFAKFVNRPDFSSIIKTELNLLSYLEKKFADVKLDAQYSSKTLVENFNKLTKADFKLDPNFKVTDDGDVLDSINYLVTFCKNIFKVDLDDLVAGKNVAAEAPSISFKSQPEAEEEAASAFAGAGIPLSGSIYENPFMMGKAYAKLNEEVKNGNVYTYKTKPKMIPIIKKVSIALMLLTCLIAIAVGIAAFCANGMTANVIVDSKTETQHLSSITVGIMYLLLAGIGAFCASRQIISIVGTKKVKPNDNTKYVYEWQSVLIFVLCMLFVSLLDIRLVWATGFDPINDGMHYAAYMTFRWLWVALIASIVINIVPLVIGAVSNPKPDKELVERKLKEYCDAAAASTGFAQPAQPTAEFQKPVEAVKPEEKKQAEKPAVESDKKDETTKTSK